MVALFSKSFAVLGDENKYDVLGECGWAIDFLFLFCERSKIPSISFDKSSEGL